MTSISLRAVARKLLANKSYDIEFHGFLSNHAKHAIVALERLAAPEERVQEYWDQYTSLTPYKLPLHRVPREDWEDVKPATKAEFHAWRGKKTNWQQQAAFLWKELHETMNGDTDKLVRTYAPDLLPGIAGALTHGIIHLGWAIDANSPWMIVEGLAYLNFCFLEMDPNDVNGRDQGGVDEHEPMDSFLRVARTFETERLKTTWVERVKTSYDASFHSELVPAGFQWELSKVLVEPHRVVTTTPSWLQEKAVEDVWRSLYRDAVYIFLATRDANGNSNFVVLHLLSSLWGLEQTVAAMKRAGLSENVERYALECYFKMTIALLSTGASGFPNSSLLEQALREKPTSLRDPTTFDWEPIVKAGIKEEEEHNIKLVYIMREMWKREDRWSGFSEAAKAFTLTPKIGPSSASLDADST